MVALAAVIVMWLSSGCDERSAMELDGDPILDVARDGTTLDVPVKVDAAVDTSDSTKRRCTLPATDGFVAVPPEYSGAISEYLLAASGSQGCVDYRVEWTLAFEECALDDCLLVAYSTYGVDICSRCDEPMQAHWWLTANRSDDFSDPPLPGEPIPLGSVEGVHGFFMHGGPLGQISPVLEQASTTLPIPCRTWVFDGALDHAIRIFDVIEPGETLRLEPAFLTATPNCCSADESGACCPNNLIDSTKSVTVRLPVPRLWPATRDWRTFPADRQMSVACELAGITLAPEVDVLDLAPWSPDEPLYLDVRDVLLPEEAGRLPQYVWPIAPPP